MDQNKISIEKGMPEGLMPVVYDGVVFPPFPGIFPEPERKFKEKSEMECRESDVFLCSFPKAGTHWTHEIIAMLISRSSKYNTFSTFENMVEAIPSNEMLDSKHSPRFLMTHLPYKYLPSQLKHGTGKIVYVQRNPKDLHVSMYNHQKGKGMMNDGTTWAEFFDMFVVGERKMLGGWFQYSKDWENEFHKKNILPLFYEEMKQDIVGNILKVAEFLELPCTNEFAQEIADKCSFNKLKNNKIDATALLDKDKKSTLFRKGQVGDWKNWFTVSQNERFDFVYSEEMKDSKLRFTYEQ